MGVLAGAVVGVLLGAVVGVLAVVAVPAVVGVVSVVAPARPARPNVMTPASAVPAITLRTIWCMSSLTRPCPAHGMPTHDGTPTL